MIWRSAERRDLETVIELIRQDNKSPIDGHAGVDRLVTAFEDIDARDDAHLIVGELDGLVVATYQIFIIEAVSLSAPRRAQIEDVRVEARHRGRGIGVALMGDAERRAKLAGATLVQLLSNQARLAAHDFYNARGYTASHFGFKKPI